MECTGAPALGPDGSMPDAISMSNLYKPAEDYEVSGTLIREKVAQASKILDYLPPRTSTDPTG